MAEGPNSKPRTTIKRAEIPPLEWAASALGLVLTLGVVGAIGWEAMNATDEPPAVAVSIERIVAAEHGYVVEVVARNASSATAAEVEIEGELKRGGETVATSTSTLDYVPGRSEARGGLFFEDDPRGHQLSVRALGYTEP